MQLTVPLFAVNPFWQRNQPVRLSVRSTSTSRGPGAKARWLIFQTENRVNGVASHCFPFVLKGEAVPNRNKHT